MIKPFFFFICQSNIVGNILFEHLCLRTITYLCCVDSSSHQTPIIQGTVCFHISYLDIHCSRFWIGHVTRRPCFSWYHFLISRSFLIGCCVMTLAEQKHFVWIQYSHLSTLNIVNDIEWQGEIEVQFGNSIWVNMPEQSGGWTSLLSVWLYVNKILHLIKSHEIFHLRAMKVMFLWVFQSIYM